MGQATSSAGSAACCDSPAPAVASSSSSSSAGAVRERRNGIEPTGSFVCGIAAGIAVTCLLNPWDRALYLSVVHRRAFIAPENWRTPYRGLTQTLMQRSISSGLYFPLEERCTRILGNPMLGGPAAGVLNSVLLNPLSLIKYQTWGAEEPRSFASQARQMYRDRGFRVFARGVQATCLRDMVFGLCFSLRRYLPVDEDVSDGTRLAYSVACAGAGTVASAPFNYVRNMAYATSTGFPLETWASKSMFWRDSFRTLAAEVAEQETHAARLRHLQARLRLGWGTMRVAVGMALTDQVYRSCSQNLSLRA